MADTTVTGKRFKLSDYIKDGNLARIVRAEFLELKGDDLVNAQEAVIEVAGAGIPGNFEQLADAYKQAISRAIHPERTSKLLKDPHVDRAIIKNPPLAEHLDKELVDVTADEVAAVNKALKAIIEDARRARVVEVSNGVRWVMHEGTEVCRVHNQAHPTVPVEDRPPCGYYRPPDDWRELLRLEVRKALGR